MKPELSRRQFLRTAGTLAGAGMAKPASWTAQPDLARNVPGKLPRLFPGCCAYSYRKYLDLKHPTMTLEDFIRRAPALKLMAVDMTAYYFKSTDPAYLASLRDLAYRHAVSFSGAACGASLVQADADAREQAVAEARQWVDVADRLGAPHLRIFAGELPPGHTTDEAIGWVVEGMKRTCDYAGKKGIMIGVEDHFGITQRADVCLEIIQRVSSPWAGINLDITHFVPTATQDAYAQIEACIPHATNTHIRDEFDDKTRVDMDRVWQMFARAGFQGYMSVEYERNLSHDEDAATGVPALVAEVRRLCEKYSTA
jgi:sugar phosphate isomerase/epimerase